MPDSPLASALSVLRLCDVPAYCCSVFVVSGRTPADGIGIGGGYHGDVHAARRARLELQEQGGLEVKFEELTAEVEKHNRILERTYQLEADMAVTRNDIEALYREVVNLNPPQIR